MRIESESHLKRIVQNFYEKLKNHENFKEEEIYEALDAFYRLRMYGELESIIAELLKHSAPKRFFLKLREYIERLGSWDLLKGYSNEILDDIPYNFKRHLVKGRVEKRAVSRKIVLLIAEDSERADLIRSELEIRNFIVFQTLVSSKFFKIKFINEMIPKVDAVWIERFNFNFFNRCLSKELFSKTLITSVSGEDLLDSIGNELVVFSDWLVFPSESLWKMLKKEMRFLDIFKNRASFFIPGTKYHQVKPSISGDTILFYLFGNKSGLILAEQLMMRLKDRDMAVFIKRQDEFTRYHLGSLKRSYLRNLEIIDVIDEEILKNIEMVVFPEFHLELPVDVLKFLKNGLKILMFDSPSLEDLIPEDFRFKTVDEALESLDRSKGFYLLERPKNDILDIVEKATAYKTRLLNNDEFFTEIMGEILSGELSLNVLNSLFDVMLHFRKDIKREYRFFTEIYKIRDPYMKLVERGKYLLKRWGVLVERKSDFDRRFGVILPLMDISQSVGIFFKNLCAELLKLGWKPFVVNLKSPFVLSMEDEWRKTRKVLDEIGIPHFIPSEMYADLNLKEIVDFLNEAKLDVIVTSSINLVLENVLLFEFYKVSSHLMGKFVPQDVESFDHEFDFLITGSACEVYNYTTCFDRLLPVETDIIDDVLDVKRTFGIEESKKVAISIGRDIKYKSEVFWSFINTLLENVPDLVFIVFGVNRADEFYKDAINEKLLKTRRVILMGKDMNARRYLKSSDIYINSFPLGGGISVNDAYYAGIPIVTPVLNEEGTRGDVEYFALNSLLKRLFIDYKSLFPKYGDVDALVELTVRLLYDNEFKEFYNSKKRYSRDYFTYREFTKDLEKFLFHLLKEKGVIR